MIFLAFLLVRHAMTISELSELTGLSDDSIRPAVKSLAAKGLLFKQLGEHGRTTWLPAGDTFFGHIFQNPQKPDSGTVLSSSSAINQKLLPIVKEQEEEEPESAKTGFCLKACDEAGIREPKRSKIAHLQHVSPEFISAHVAQGKAQGVALGTVIFRIENNWEVNERFMKKPITREEEVRRKVLSFINGD